MNRKRLFQQLLPSHKNYFNWRLIRSEFGNEMLLALDFFDREHDFFSLVRVNGRARMVASVGTRKMETTANGGLYSR